MDKNNLGLSVVTNSKVQSKKQRIYYFIAILLPVLFFLILELFLRGIGYGKEYPLFVASDEFPGYMQPNPDVINRYFSSPEMAPNVSPDTVYFPSKKTKDVFRIVIQGGSTAAGFPFGRFGSLQGMLEQRFKRAYPEKNIEIINTAMAAVNSYTLLDFVDEIIEIEPDLVLLYAGHNEYLGVLGVGSTYGGSTSRLTTLTYLALKDFKLYQLLESLVMTLKKKTETSDSEQSSRSLMSKVAQGQHIEFGSELYQKGITQFSENLDVLLSKYASAGIDIFVGNLVSIERGMPPFSSIGKFDWQKFDPSLNQSEYLDTNDLASNFYQKGLVQYSQHEFSKASDNFNLARDHDSLRFRAPSEFNRIIERLSDKHQATRIDVESHIRQESINGILAEEHLLEHVHPTVRGYFLLADSFFNEIVKSKVINAQKHPSPANVAWQNIPLSDVDIAYGQYKIAHLKSDYPFSAEPKPKPQLRVNTELDKLIANRIQGQEWLSLQKEIIRYYQKKEDFSNAARVAGVIASAIPNDAKSYQMAGRLYLQANDLSLAYYHFNKSFKLDSTNANYALNYAHVLFLMKRYKESLKVLELGQTFGEQSQKFARFISQVKKNIN